MANIFEKLFKKEVKEEKKEEKVEKPVEKTVNTEIKRREADAELRKKAILEKASKKAK